ncbi:Hypothetical predicted protein, partial [Mytilus galloprovincialis]
MSHESYTDDECTMSHESYTDDECTMNDESYTDDECTRSDESNTDDACTISNYGNTTLHIAARRGNLLIFEMQLALYNRAHRDPDKKNTNGDTILQSAIMGKNPEIVKCILDSTSVQPSVKNMNGDTALHSAARRGNLETLKLLLERSDVDLTEKNQLGNTPYDLVETYWVDSEEKQYAKEVLQ